MSNNRVKGTVVDGFDCSIAQFWGSGPKLTILCGGCKRHYKERVAPAKFMTAICPHCGKLNLLDVTTV